MCVCMYKYKGGWGHKLTGSERCFGEGRMSKIFLHNLGCQSHPFSIYLKKQIHIHLHPFLTLPFLNTHNEDNLLKKHPKISYSSGSSTTGM